MEELFLGKVDADFLPRLAHRRVQAVFVFFIAASTWERDMRRPVVIGAHGTLDEQQFRGTALDPRQCEKLTQACLDAHSAVRILLHRRWEQVRVVLVLDLPVTPLAPQPRLVLFSRTHMQNQSHTRTTRLRRWTLQHAWRDLGDAGEPMLQVREQRGRHGRPVWSLGNLSVRVEGWARWAHVALPKKGRPIAGPGWYGQALLRLL